MKYLGYCVFLILFVLSIIFYMDRMMMPDTAFLVTHILYSGDLQIQVERFVAVFTQIVPYSLAKIGAPLWVILMGYSASFVVFYTAFFSFFKEYWKDERWAWAVLLYCILMCTHVFYWVQPELHQGTMFILLSGVLLHKIEKWTIPTGILLGFSILTAFYSHPLSVFPFVFMLGYLWLNRENLNINSSIIYIALGVFFGFFILKNYVLTVNYYDADASEMSRQNFYQSWKRFYKLQTFRRFFSVKYLLNYWIFIGSFLGVIGYYFYKKSWLNLAFLSVFVLGYFYFITCCYPQDVDAFYIEHLYLPMSFFVALPLAFEILPIFKINKTAFFVISILLIIRIVAICNADKIYSHRVNYMNAILEKTKKEPNKKLIIADNLIEKTHFLQTWGTGYQALLQSAAKSPDSCRLVLFTADKTRFDTASKRKNVIVTEFNTFKYEKFPKRYFNLQDTTSYVGIRNPQNWLAW